jgi:hypothetical protein
MSSDPAGEAAAPVADHHQHLFSPTLNAECSGLQAISAREVVALLDEAHIRQALVLSGAYLYGSPARPISVKYLLSV